jgi:hypothetical protein
MITELVANKYSFIHLQDFGMHEKFSPSKASRPTQPHTQMVTEAISQGLKTPEREPEQPPPANARVKNERSYVSSLS